MEIAEQIDDFLKERDKQCSLRQKPRKAEYKIL